MALDPLLLGLILFTLLISGGVLWAVHRQQRKQQSALQRLDAATGALARGELKQASHAGLDYRYWFEPGGRNRPSSLSLRTACPSGGRFKLEREGRLDRLGKRLGIAEEVQTGDSRFDREVYILSDTPHFARSTFLEAERRAAVEALFALGCSSVELADGALTVRWSPFDPARAEDGRFILDAVAQLARLGRDLPPTPSGRLPEAGWKLRRAAVYALGAVSLSAGGAGVFAGLHFYPPLDGGELFVATLPYSLPALALALWLAVVGLRGRAGSHRELFIAAALLLPGIPLAGFGGALLANGALDSSAPVTHRVAVLGKRISRSDDSVSYYLTVRSWRPGRSREEIQIERDLYQRLEAGRDQALITSRAGYLGYEWVAGCRPVRARD